MSKLPQFFLNFPKNCKFLPKYGNFLRIIVNLSKKMPIFSKKFLIFPKYLNFIVKFWIWEKIKFLDKRATRASLSSKKLKGMQPFKPTPNSGGHACTSDLFFTYILTRK